MDREYLLRRHEHELVNARAAATDVARQGRQALARAFLDAANKLGSPTVVEFVSHNRSVA